MSSIDPRLNTNLSAGLDALDRQRLDDLQGRQGQIDATQPVADLAPADGLRTPALDDGEAVLNAPAWAAADGDRQLDGGNLQDTLAVLERGQAVDAGVDGIVDGLE